MKIAFTLLIILVGLGRLFEMRISRLHQHELSTQGVQRGADPVFPVMVVLHIAILVGAVLEVWLLDRPFIPLLGLVAGAIFLAANGLRWWVIRTLDTHWNVQVMDSMKLGVVTDGPYRYVRHPNYAAVYLELLALPLIHTAYLTAIIGAILHAWVLSQRIKAEEAVLLANPNYQAAMGGKPRFVPFLKPND